MTSNSSDGLGRSTNQQEPTGKPPRSGRVFSEEHLAHLREAQRRRDPKTRNTSGLCKSGDVSPRRGQHASEETRAKWREAWGKRPRRGVWHHTEEAKRKISDSYKRRERPLPKNFLGKKHTEEARRKMSEARKGKKSSAETRRKLSILAKSRPLPAFIGKSPSVETRRKLSESHRGDKSYLWKGGITAFSRAVRTGFRYRQWRSDIFHRDDFVCADCGVRGGQLNAHHCPKNFAQILDEWHIKTLGDADSCAELWDLNNGITLCMECHRRRHAMGEV